MSASLAVLAPAVRPTARTVPWSPLVGTGVMLLLVLATLELSGAADAGAARWLGLAAVASAVVLALRDEAAGWTAALPGSRLGRRLLRLAIVLTVAVPACATYVALLPGAAPDVAPDVALPLLGLLASAVAVATWLPDDARVGAAAALPLAWAASHELLGDALGPVGTVAALWHDHPWPVAAVAAVAVVAGRSR